MQITRYHDGRRYDCRRHTNGTFYIHWTEDRRSHRVSTRQKDVAAAQAFLDQWLTMEATGTTALTIDDLYSVKYPDPSDRVVASWKRLSAHFGGKVVRDLTVADEARYIATRRREGVARATIRAEIATFRAILNHAVKQRLISVDDVPPFGPLPPDSPPRDRWLRDDEVDRLFAAAEGVPRVRMFLYLALETAARRTAIEELEWRQVDWETGVVHYMKPGEVQTRKRKASVPMSKRLRAVMETAYAGRVDPYVIGRGGHLNEALHRVAREAGVDGVTPHVLRHTAATRMARRGVPLWIIAKVLGNTVEQVEKVYAKHSPEMLVSAVEAISGEAAA